MPTSTAADASPAAARAVRLEQIDALPGGDAQPLALLFERACLLDSLGRNEDARRAFLAVLARDSGHAGALNELGRLLDRTGYHIAARTVFGRAVDLHPDDPTGQGNLASSLLDAGDAVTARRHYEIAARLEPDNLEAHRCLAILDLREGDPAGAAAHARVGFRDGARTWPYRGSATPIPIVVLHSALGGNIPIDRFIDDRVFAKWTVVAEFADPAQPLPPHALIVNAIGDADRCRTGLRAAQALLARTSAPVVNLPQRVRATARPINARRLAHLPGVIAPRAVTRSRSALTGPQAAHALAAAGFQWPLILRTPGFHTGKNCLLVERAADLTSAVAALPGDDLLVVQFHDVRDSDGAYRKYRVMIVDGTIFPLHLAISTHWMVHYYTAEMHDHANRAQDANFVHDMPRALGPAAMAALEGMAARLGLDYGGVDFALDPAGRIVVFEANATMIVAPPPDDARWSYRRAPIERIEAAVRAMLLRRCDRAIPAQAVVAARA
jgi:hypothetical protein